MEDDNTRYERKKRYRAPFFRFQVIVYKKKENHMFDTSYVCIVSSVYKLKRILTLRKPFLSYGTNALEM